MAILMLAWSSDSYVDLFYSWCQSKPSGGNRSRLRWLIFQPLSRSGRIPPPLHRLSSRRQVMRLTRTAMVTNRRRQRILTKIRVTVVMPVSMKAVGVKVMVQVTSKRRIRIRVAATVLAYSITLRLVKRTLIILLARQEVRIGRGEAGIIRVSNWVFTYLGRDGYFLDYSWIMYSAPWSQNDWEVDGMRVLRTQDPASLLLSPHSRFSFILYADQAHSWLVLSAQCSKKFPTFKISWASDGHTLAKKTGWTNCHNSETLIDLRENRNRANC